MLGVFLLPPFARKKKKKKKPKRESNPESVAREADVLTTRPTRRCVEQTAHSPAAYVNSTGQSRFTARA